MYIFLEAYEIIILPQKHYKGRGTGHRKQSNLGNNYRGLKIERGGLDIRSLPSQMSLPPSTHTTPLLPSQYYTHRGNQHDVSYLHFAGSKFIHCATPHTNDKTTALICGMICVACCNMRVKSNTQTCRLILPASRMLAASILIWITYL